VWHQYDEVYYLCPPSKKRGHIVLQMSVSRSVGPSVHLSLDQMISDHYLKNYLSQGFHTVFHMLIGLGKDMTPIDFGFTRSNVKVTWVTFIKKIKMVSAHYLENNLLQSFHMSHADWSQ